VRKAENGHMNMKDQLWSERHGRGPIASLDYAGFRQIFAGPAVLARIAAILLEHEREQRSHGAVDD
jgi:hypothetical protein